MEPATVDELFTQLSRQAGLADDVRREPVRAWALSGVERLHLSDGATLFFKHAAAPFTAEARVLRHVARHGVPVPQVIAAVERTDALGVLLEDLGPEARPANTTDAAEAAIAVHRTPAPDDVPLLDEKALAALPASCLTRLDKLRTIGRWHDTAALTAQLEDLETIAADRAQAAELPPFGLCHSEFHPTSLHMAAKGWRLLDWARAFHGPGLLDLASWQNTVEAPNFAAFGRLLDAYIAAGGSPDAALDRGGLPPERWAYGWHRLWVIDWYLHQATTWIADPTQDPTYQRVLRRHLTEAIACLQPTQTPPPT